MVAANILDPTMTFGFIKLELLSTADKWQTSGLLDPSFTSIKPQTRSVIFARTTTIVLFSPLSPHTFLSSLSFSLHNNKSSLFSSILSSLYTTTTNFIYLHLFTLKWIGFTTMKGDLCQTCRVRIQLQDRDEVSEPGTRGIIGCLLICLVVRWIRLFSRFINEQLFPESMINAAKLYRLRCRIRWG